MSIKVLAARAIRISRRHGLDLRFFLCLFVTEVSLRALFYVPQLGAGRLHLLVALRILSLAGPLYVLLRGRGIAPVFNLSLLFGWSLKTAWEVCYFVFF